jgi:hypothetical protein
MEDSRYPDYIGIDGSAGNGVASRKVKERNETAS